VRIDSSGVVGLVTVFRAGSVVWSLIG